MTSKYPEEKYADEFHACLYRAFVEAKMDSVCIDSRRGTEFLYSAACYGEKMGWLSDIHEGGSDEAQYTSWTWHLTEAGKEHFKIQHREKIKEF